MIMFIIFQIFIGYLYATWLEWAIHKYVLHGLGKKKGNWLNFHWDTHHKACRKNKNFDENYNRYLSSPVLKEMTGLCLLAVAHLPIYFVMPYLYYTLIFCSVRDFYMHQKAHLDVEWGKVHLPWHYEHHMGKNQNANWGVTTALWDAILGTRIK